MFDYIENLKTKPEHIRKRFAFLTSFVFTFIVFAGWMASYGFTSSAVVADNNSVDKPVSSLTATVVGAYDDIKNLIFGSNKTGYSADAIQISGGGR